jgi:pantoate--beta-alanine ligase
MSSRNKYLNPAQRAQATVLSQSIRLAKEAVARKPESAASLEKKIRRLIAAQPEARIDYIAFFHPESLAPAKTVTPGTQLALAVFIGATRLIDNSEL